MGPMGFFALVSFLILMLFFWKQMKRSERLERRFNMVLLVWREVTEILAKLAAAKKPIVDVSEQVKNIERLLDAALVGRRRDDDDDNGDRSWWRRLTS